SVISSRGCDRLSTTGASGRNRTTDPYTRRHAKVPRGMGSVLRARIVATGAGVTAGGTWLIRCAVVTGAPFRAFPTGRAIRPPPASARTYGRRVTRQHPGTSYHMHSCPECFSVGSCWNRVSEVVGFLGESKCPKTWRSCPHAYLR